MTTLPRQRARPVAAAGFVPSLSASALTFLLLTGYAASFSAHGQIASTPRPVIEEQRQQERERVLREQQERTVDARLPRQPAPDEQRLSNNEPPCLRID